MIKRIVKMTFREEAVPAFLQVFEESKDVIRGFEGCRSVELLQDVRQPTVLFTLSVWEDEAALERYRQSDFFKTTWQRTKVLFAEQRAEAWSLVLV